MKKVKTIIGIILIIVAVLFVPIPRTSYDDGGTKEYKALTYKVVKWHRIIDIDHIFSQTEVYWFPDNFKSVDELFDGIEIDWATPLQSDTEGLSETDTTEETVK